MKLQENIDNLRATAFKTLQASFDGMLESVGLQLAHKGKNMTLPMLGAFGAGLLVGSGTALLLAPMQGSDLRARLMSIVGLRAGTKGEHADASDAISDDAESAPVEAKRSSTTKAAANGHTRPRPPVEPVSPG